MSDEIPSLVEGGWTARYPIAGPPDGLALLTWPDGSIGLRHVCHRPRDGRTIIVAPRLQLDAGHRVEHGPPSWTISPSCGCSDCGLHGFIVNGAWRAC